MNDTIEINFASEIEFDSVVNLTTQNQLPSDCYFPTDFDKVSSTIGKLFLILLYSLTSLAALVGNVTVIVVELYGSESAQNIRRYLINLAVSDIIISVLTVPFTYTSFMLGYWMFPHWLCPTASFVQLLSVFVTSITLTIIGIERYLAILHPFSNLHHWLESHTHLMLISTWIFGASYALIPLENTHTTEFIADNSTYHYCNYGNNLSTVKRRFFISSNLILTFLLPLVILICTYSTIMRKLLSDQQQNIRQSQVTFRCSDGTLTENILRPRSSSINHNSKTIKMMFTVILLFGICWMPIKLYQFLLDYSLIYFCSEISYNLLIFGYFVCHWTAMASSFVNPIVYSFMSRSFRKDFHKIYHKTLLRNNHQASQQTNSSQV